MTPSSSADLPSDLLPLFVGITGHSDLRPQDIEPLREVVRRELRAFRARYPHTPLIVLSPLGEGADRLIACVALEEGCALIVPLPLPRQQYEKSFSSDESRAEFAGLLERASEVFTLPWVAGSEEENRMAAGELTQAQIEGQYAAMGAYLARYSHILLALWDGDDLPEHERTGGTAHIVRLRLHGAPPPYGPVISPLERAGYGAVHHLVTPRQSRPLSAGAGEPFSLHIKPNAEAAEDFSRIDAFNADVQKLRATLGDSAQRNANYLIASADNAETASNTEIPDNLRFPMTIYGWSDAMSSVFARQMAHATRRVFLLVFFAALSFNLFHSLPHGTHHETGNSSHATSAVTSPTEHEAAIGADVPATAEHGSTSHAAPTVSETHGEILPVETSDESHGGFSLASLWSLLPWFLWLYLLLVVVNVVLHGRTEKQELQTKYQDYRALAEGLRVQIYWRLAGLRDDVSDHYLGKQRGELNWIRHAIKSCNVLADAQQKSAPHTSAPLSLIVQSWAQDQRNYYVSKAHREHHELEKQEKLIGALVVASIALSVALGLLLTLPSLLPLPLLEPFKAMVEVPLTHALIMICIVMLAVTAGLLHGYNALMARAEHSKRYGRMGTLFETACQELEAQLSVGHSHKTSTLLHELGREALAENGDWVMLHRERPLEVPHAG